MNLYCISVYVTYMLHAFLNVIFFLDNRVRLSCRFGRDVTLLCVGTFYSCNGMYVPNFCGYEISKWVLH